MLILLLGDAHYLWESRLGTGNGVEQCEMKKRWEGQKKKKRNTEDITFDLWRV